MSRLRSKLGNPGRFAGMGMLYDEYGEESYPDHPAGNKVRVRLPQRTSEERMKLNSRCITYYLTEEELALYRDGGVDK